jgi:hypothetical protein
LLPDDFSILIADHCDTLDVELIGRLY